MPLVKDDQSRGGLDEEIEPSTIRGHFLSSASRKFNASLTGDSLHDLVTELESIDHGRMTTSRRLVEGFLEKFKWYYPAAGEDERNPNAPSLSKAWAYYEHITLARHFKGLNTADHTLERAEPGQKDDKDKKFTTELYSPWTTPETSLNQWGLGISSYFTTLRCMALILLVVGLINIANVLYYASDDYSGPRSDTNLSKTLYGSAICTDTEWVVCDNCKEQDFNEETKRFATYGTGDAIITLVEQNNCLGAEFAQGIINWASLVVLILCVALLMKYLQLRETVFDEDKITSTDYSVTVKNPPPDALDPDDWHSFFSQFAEKQVTFVTIAINNEELVRKLVGRRVFRDSLRRQLPPDVDLNHEDTVRVAVAEAVRERAAEPKGCFWGTISCTVIPLLNVFNMLLPPEKLMDKIYELEPEIRELQKQEYKATEVFVTFETEMGQRNALEALTTSSLNIKGNRTNRVVSSTVFQGRVLNLREPAEPNAVRWLDLSVPAARKLMVRLITFAITVAMVAFAAFIIQKVRKSFGPQLSGPMITIFNATIPFIIKILMIFESHSTEGRWQRSLYLKITVFRWVNTAIIVQIITPFTTMLGSTSSDILPVIDSILWSEMLLAPFLRLLDPISNIRKHIMAPRAKNQESMNSNFQGTVYLLGERYTDFTKVLFLCVFYSALHPAAFLFGFAILTIQYYTDKFCLMRIWFSAPLIGKEVSVFSRHYFFSTAMLAFAIASSYAYAHFPYDNLCYTEEPQNRADPVVYNDARLQDGTTIDISVLLETTAQFCNQQLFNTKGNAFPATPAMQGGLEWMTESQEKLTLLYGWTSVVVLVVYMITVFGGSLSKYIFGIFFGSSYKPQGQDQHIDFSTNLEISAYVPQVKRSGYFFPFLAVDVDGVSDDLIGWTDDKHSLDHHNIIYDMPYEGMKRKRGENPDTDGESSEKTYKKSIFSIVKHWSPDWAKNNE